MAVTGRHFLLCGAAGEAVPSPEPVAEPLDAASRLVHEVGVRLQSHVSIVYSCVHPACNTMYPPYMCLGAANGILWPWRASAGPPHSLDRCTAGKRSRRLHGHRTPPRSPAASPCWRHTLHYARCGVWCVVCGVWCVCAICICICAHLVEEVSAAAVHAVLDSLTVGVLGVKGEAPAG